MTLPGFSAGYSLYSRGGHYRIPSVTFSGQKSAQSVVPAYGPGAQTEAKCTAARESCRDSSLICLAGALLFPPAIIGCDTALLGCMGATMIPGNDCCPTFCQLGDCCDYGETCVEKNKDRNTRTFGCCPAGQSVCGGRCCPPGDHCCGDTCCPPGPCCGNGCGCRGGQLCLNGTCGFPPFGPFVPVEPGVTQIPKPASGCPQGWKECLNGTVCCAPDMKCCGNGCDASCVN